MATFIGIDGIRGGWVGVYTDENRAQRFIRSARLADLLADSYNRAMIDIPIGLPERGYRQCDVEARKLVGSTVFLGARWNVWKFRTFEEANRRYWEDKDKGISQQLWCIRGKLQEVNEGMTPEQQSRLQESHPELVFWRLNGCTPLTNKKKSGLGRAERIAFLKQPGFDQIENWLDKRRGTGIGRDDLIDACACAVAAREHDAKIPAAPEVDCRGLRMEMWY
jgi:predicted RNase H-like nuclease